MLARTSRLFFDASCLFAAAHSPLGGSAYLLAVCARGYEDAHVIAAALAASADFLIILDRRLARRAADADLGIAALSPKTFLQDVLPDHPEYLSIRQEA